MPRAAPATPRKMLPAPTTIATCTPRPRAARTCRAIAPMRTGSMPYVRSPRSASPESFSTTRWNRASPSAGTAPSARGSAELPTELIADEAPDRDVLSDLRRDLLAQRIEGARLLPALVADELLLEKGERFQPLGELALDGALAEPLVDVLRLLHEDRPLALPEVLGNVLQRQERRVQ